MSALAESPQQTKHELLENLTNLENANVGAASLVTRLPARVYHSALLIASLLHTAFFCLYWIVVAIPLKIFCAASAHSK